MEQQEDLEREQARLELLAKEHDQELLNEEEDERLE